MPLSKGTTRATVSKNVREMMDSGYPQKQAVAAALDNQRRSRKSKRTSRKAHRSPRKSGRR